MDEDKNRTSISSANVEQNTGDGSLPEDRFAEVASLVSIRVISYRKLNHDPDGISAKAVIDGLTHAGIFADDSAKQVKEVTFESRKSKEERTIIEITNGNSDKE